VIDARLPVATDAPTIYARYGDWTVLALILLGLLGVRSRVPKA
jgi:apolipoprotein N-acyltransferase